MIQARVVEIPRRGVAPGDDFGFKNVIYDRGMPPSIPAGVTIDEYRRSRVDSRPRSSAARAFFTAYARPGR